MIGTNKQAAEVLDAALLGRRGRRALNLGYT